MKEKFILEEWMEPFINEYCGNDMYGIKKVCIPFALKNNIPEMYWHDLFDDAQNVLMETLLSFDESMGNKFFTYFKRNVENSLKEWIRNSLRNKRCNLLKGSDGKLILDEKGKPTVIQNVSLDFHDEDQDITIADIISDGYNLEEDAIDKMDFLLDPDFAEYMRRLSKKQRKIAIMLAKDIPVDKILVSLCISLDEFKSNLESMRSYENTKVFLQYGRIR